jgi:hypothetical protein
MKKLLIATNVLMAGLLIFQACNTATDKRTYPDRNPSTGSYCADTSCYSNAVGALRGMISYATAKKICDNYGNDINKKYIYLNGVNTKMEDSRSVWLDLEKLKNFIAYIEKSACAAGCNKRNTQLGVRVYFAKYPSEATILSTPDLKNGVRPDFANHATLFLSPTYYDATRRRHIDFDPAAVKGNCTFPPIDSIKGRVWSLVGDGTTNTTGDQQNHGDLKPPPDGTGAFPEQ